jgi:pimeloyl-ACP methyl ester carboxylesterase
MHFFYLHGFASSPASGKARYCRERLAELGQSLESPDFNLPDFGSLTVTRMLDQLDAAIDARPPGPVTLIGSSLGGFVALHAASRRRSWRGRGRPVTRLILLAPALDFCADWHTDGIVDEWRRVGHREVFHYAYDRPMNIGFELYEDARRYRSAAVELDIPTLVFQGRRDEVVAPAGAIEFTSRWTRKSSGPPAEPGTIVSRRGVLVGLGTASVVGVGASLAAGSPSDNSPIRPPGS